MKLAEYPRTATFSWSHDRVPILATGTASGAVDADFSSNSTLDFWSLLSFDVSKPSGSIVADAKFNDLDWSNDNKIVAGALENGVVEFFDPKALKSVAKIHKHVTPVKTLRFNSKQSNVLVSGGSKGEIFVWDSNKIGSADYSPFSSGTAITPIDEVSSLAWNQSLAHVFASAGSSGYASIWDLKAKKEVIHLNYTSPTTGIKVPLSVVEWHPSNSTRIATASNLDSEPAIMVWDLRNSNVPLNVLSQGHGRGILSLDWCKQDENLLLSSGRDNSSILWNPEDGTLLTRFATRGNWVFKSKFAPEAPDLFASASFDSKIIVQSLQTLTTSLDTQATETKQKESEDEFWNNVTENTVDEKPRVCKVQAPAWYGNKSPAAQWAFGGKLVKITNDHKGVSITKPSISESGKNELLDESLQSKDFVKLINKRLSEKINSTNEEDWNLLENLSMDGTELFLKDALSLEDSALNNNNKGDEEGADFFDLLKEKFIPQGPFKFDFSEEVKPITNALIKGDLKSALSHSLEKDLLLEAMIIAITSDDANLKEKVKTAYFSKFSNKSNLARTLFSVSENNVEDIVQNVEVSQWKDAVQFIYTSSKNQDERNALLVKLGDRLLADGKRKDAILLYLAGRSIDSIASVWLKEFPQFEAELKSKRDTLYEAHLECLTEFVERLTVLSSYLNDGSSMKMTNQELISKFLEFVNVAATNGNFDLALKFLDNLPGDNEEVKADKQRVLIASGKSISHIPTAENIGQSRQTRYGSSSLPVTNAGPRSSVGGILPPSNPLAAGSHQIQQASIGLIPRQPSFVSSTPASAVPASNPYAPIQNQTVQQPVASKTPFASVTNPYAPSINPNVPANPYAPQPVAASASNVALSPPPISGHRGLSGQTPHLHGKPIDGWNDLPSVTKEKHVRAKAVNTAPIGMSATNYAPPEVNSGLVAPVPRGTMPMTAPPPLKKASKPSSPSTIISPSPVPLKKTNSYAPPPSSNNFAQPPQGNSMMPPSSPGLGSNNQHTFVPPVNPYGPSQKFQPPTGIIPPNVPMSNTPPPPPKNKTVPPPKMNRKSHVAGDANAATDLLSSIQSKPVPEPKTNHYNNTPLPIPAQSSTSSLSHSTSNVDSPEPRGITENERPIVEFLTSELQRVTPLIPQEYNKQLKDCDKRLHILFKHLEKHDLLTQPTIEKLHQIVALLKENKYSEAMSIHQDLSVNHNSEAGNWLTGVKRLISIAEATSSQ